VKTDDGIVDTLALFGVTSCCGPTDRDSEQRQLLGVARPASDLATRRRAAEPREPAGRKIA
jgi:hypothetical protein